MGEQARDRDRATTRRTDSVLSPPRPAEAEAADWAPVPIAQIRSDAAGQRWSQERVPDDRSARRPAVLRAGMSDGADPLGGTEIRPDVMAVLRRTQGRGEPLPDDVGSRAGRTLGRDLSDVRIHSGSDAATVTRAVQAAAFTYGTDIYFSEGSYRPRSRDGQRLLAHELGHVGQSTAGAGTIGRADDPAEAAADRTAVHVIGALRRRTAPLESHDRSGPSRTLTPGKADIRRQKEPSAIFDSIDRINGQRPAHFNAAEVKRIFYWNAQNSFDAGQLQPGEKVDDAITRLSAVTIPQETAAIGEGDLTPFMSARNAFTVTLPDEFGGGVLNFKKGKDFKMFEGRGWISENVYWRAPAPQGQKRVRYMVHGILEWNAKTGPQDPPNPHLTLRNAETQAMIDLDMTSPLPRPEKKPGGRKLKASELNPSRVADKDATNSSFSRGLGETPRRPGTAMVNDEATFAELRGETVKAWLTTLQTAAQTALIPVLARV